MLLWGLATLRLHDADLATAAARQAIALLPVFTPQGLATTLWALSRLYCHDVELLHRAAPVVRRSLAAFKPQDLANVAYAAARARFADPDLFAALCGAAAHQMPAFPAQAVVNMVWACEQVGYAGHPEFVAAAARRGAQLLAAGSLQGRWLGSFVQSCVQLGFSAGLLLEAAGQRLTAASMADLPSKALCQLVVAAVAHAQLPGRQQHQPQQHARLVAAALGELALRDVSDLSCPVAMTQLHQALLLHDPSSVQLPPSWQHACRAAWHHVAAGCITDECRKDVASTLQRLSMQPQLLRWHGPVLVAIGVQLPSGQQVAVQLLADGHTLSSPAGALTGALELEHACLRRQGWHIASISQAAWLRLGSVAERQQALQAALQAAA
jgi:hypothetical protein